MNKDELKAIAANETKSAEAKIEKKEVKPRGRQKIAGDHPLKFIVDNHTKQAGNTMYYSEKVQGFASMKVNGNMYAAMTFNTKGIIIWTRGEALKDLKIPERNPIKTFNHMFDTRISFPDVDGKPMNDNAAIALIHQILDASIKFQLEKKATTKAALAKKEAAERKAQKAAEKLEKDKAKAAEKARKEAEKAEKAKAKAKKSK